MRSQQEAAEAAEARQDWWVLGPQNHVVGPYSEAEARTIVQADALKGRRRRLLKTIEDYAT